MSKENIRNRLQASIVDEAKKVESRFDNVDTLLNNKVIENKNNVKEKDTKVSISIAINKDLVRNIDKMITDIIIQAGSHKIVNRSLLIEYAIGCIVNGNVDEVISWLKQR
jgi:hypothetical protein